jgi:5-methyltetrahydropteroyltriglutamate--homocysteine methyltransferase
MEKLIPTEQIGSIPRPSELVRAYEQFSEDKLHSDALEAIAQRATIDTIRHLEDTGSPCISDGEQVKFSSFGTYCLHGAKNIAPDGMGITFSDGHTRRLPRLTSGPFRYERRADSFLEQALKYANVPVKQAVVSPSLLSLLYPQTGIAGYPRWQFNKDIINEHVNEVRRCLDLGAHKVQIDFTEGRLSLKVDPSGELLESMVEMINTGLQHFSEAECQRIGVHTCPGSDLDATHSADVDYNELLPTLFNINVGNFYIAMASEKDPELALRLIKTLLQPGLRVFIGVIDPINPHIETAEEVKERVLQAAKFIPLENLGTTDDCGFSPFVDDSSTSREIAFTKIKARVEGTRLAEEVLLGRGAQENEGGGHV